MKRFAFPTLGGRDAWLWRWRGPGLGNMLFPWARAIVAAETYGYELIEPTWVQLKLGPMLRGERDRRFYSGLFRATPRYVRGARRLWLLARSRRVEEGRPVGNHAGPTVIVFAGMRGQFSDLTDRNEQLRQRLLEIAHPKVKSRLPAEIVPRMAIHVRLGDYRRSTELERLPQGAANTATPVHWFAEALGEVRRTLGRSIEADVFSDGADSELAPLLGMTGVARSEKGSSLADMLSMACYAGLIGSNSTFAMWSSFLGEVPTIWPPRRESQRLHRFVGSEIEWVPGQRVPADFGMLIESRVGSPPKARDGNPLIVSRSLL